MTKQTERQLFSAGGTLIGWTLAQLYDKQDSVPFTVIGGLIGFFISEELIGDSPARRQLSGPRKVRKRTK